MIDDVNFMSRRINCYVNGVEAGCRDVRRRVVRAVDRKDVVASLATRATSGDVDTICPGINRHLLRVVAGSGSGHNRGRVVRSVQYGQDAAVTGDDVDFICGLVDCELNGRAAGILKIYG